MALKVALSLGDIKASVASCASAYPAIRRVFLFGSYARGEAGPRSDVDVCLETTRGFTLFQAADFKVRLEARLGIPVDVVTEKSLYDFAHAGYLKDRVLVYER